MSKRKCFYIPPTAFVEGCGFIPSMVTEGEPGHAPMTGNAPGADAWYWGLTYEAACEEAKRQNARLGISPQEAIEIVASSMGATRSPSIAGGPLHEQSSEHPNP